MEDSDVKKSKRRKKRLKPDLPEILANTRKAPIVIWKIENGQKVSDSEFISLFKSHSNEQDLESIFQSLINSEYFEDVKNFTSLYVEKAEIVSGLADFWCPNLDSEMFEYFREYPSELYSMPPRKFEELIAAIFKNNGFSVQLTPETRDGGVDIIAVQHSIFTGDSINLIECKRYSPTQKVGIGVVQRLLGAVHQKQANKGIIVTTSFFSSDAQQVANSTKHIMELKDYHSINSWLEDIRING